MPGAASRAPAFGPDWLAPRIDRLIPPAPSSRRRLVVGWSGGADSTALLGALCELRSRSRGAFTLRALHVDHQLQPQSKAWTRHCRRVARRLHVPLTVVRVDARPAPGASREAAARDARYRAFEAALAHGESLVLAQHADDQLETLLLQLLRGAGPAGLAAMPGRRALGRGCLVRPMLEAAPADLREYLRRRSLPWIEDPTNTDTALDRNYLRLEVVPRLAARWPGLRETTARSIGLLQEARRELETQAARDLARVADGEGLSLPLLRRLPPERLRSVLRAWLVRRSAALPDRARLDQIAALALLRDDAQPDVTWGDHAARRHRDRLLLLASTPRGEPAPAEDRTWRWTPRKALACRGGELRIAAAPHGDVDLDRLPSTLLVRARSGGREREPGGRSVDVKSLLRENGIPSWQRAGLPFLHDPRAIDRGDSLVAVADLWVASAVRADGASRRRGRILWRPR